MVQIRCSPSSILVAFVVVVINLALLSKILSTTNASVTSSDGLTGQARSTDNDLAGFESNTANDNIRIIALCGKSPYFDAAFRKISKWLPISYAGMYHPPENETSPQTQRVWCESKIEQWVSSELQRQKIIPTMSKTTSIEVIYSDDETFKRKSTLNTTLVGQSKDPPKWEGGMQLGVK